MKVNLSAELRRAIGEMERARRAVDQAEREIRDYVARTPRLNPARGRRAVADYWVQTDSTRRGWIRRYEFWATRVRTLSAAIAALRAVST